MHPRRGDTLGGVSGSTQFSIADGVTFKRITELTGAINVRLKTTGVNPPNLLYDTDGIIKINNGALITCETVPEVGIGSPMVISTGLAGSGNPVVILAHQTGSPLNTDTGVPLVGLGSGGGGPGNGEFLIVVMANMLDFGSPVNINGTIQGPANAQLAIATDASCPQSSNFPAFLGSVLAFIPLDKALSVAYDDTRHSPQILGTNTTADFTQPAFWSTVAVQVQSTSGYNQGDAFFIGGNAYNVSSVDSISQLTVTAVNNPGASAPGTLIPFPQACTPAGEGQGTVQDAITRSRPCAFPGVPPNSWGPRRSS